MDEEYNQYFGFTASEVREMLKYYGVLDKEGELKEWNLSAFMMREQKASTMGWFLA